MDWVFDKLPGKARPEGIDPAGGAKYFNTVMKEGDKSSFAAAFDELYRELPDRMNQIVVLWSFGLSSRES